MHDDSPPVNSRAIRERLGDGISLRADANCGYTLSEAEMFCKLVEAPAAGLELLLKEPLQLVDGYLRVPSGPGLGLELDDDQIERFRAPA